MIQGDFHCHTKYSDGKNTLEEMVASAHDKGLTQIGITEHGLRHMAFGTTRHKLKDARRVIDDIRGQYPHLDILLSIEANIYCSKGLIDLKPEDYALLDYVCAGYHMCVWGANPIDFCRYNTRGIFLHKPTRSEIATYTKAMLGAITSGKIHILTHPSYRVAVDARQIGRACADYGVLVELNGKKVSMTDQDILTIAQEGAQFIINSDAHSVDRVGEVSHPLSVATRLNLDKNSIVNYGKQVTFDKRHL